MKVVVLHPPLYPVNHSLFNELCKYCDLHIICFGDHPRYHSDWKSSDFIRNDSNYKLIIIEGISASYKLQFSTKYIKHIIKEKPDIVMSVAFWLPSLFSSFLKYFLRFKFCIITDATSFSDSGISGFKKLLRKIIVRNSDVLLSGSEFTTQYLKTLTKQESKIKKSFQTIDVTEWNRIYDDLPTKEVLRAKLNFNSEDKILLYVGQLDSNKNIVSLINQLKHLPDYKLIIVGNGPSKNELMQMSLKLKFNEQISFVDRKTNSDLIEYFKISNVFVLPSKSDTFGFVVSEALTCGLPVICTKFAGASSLIKDGYNGYVIDPTQPYFKEIQLTFNDLTYLSENARASMLPHTLENKAKQLHQIFNNLI